ncbi:hypothetical protein V6N12_033035 [Hibiscus sabdariffa]|uniref:Uncharacterized protein n=1 Tax=Hibiscus sabdariffa TaxID=183260 RepID=A0ABR2CEU4_9ROSI
MATNSSSSARYTMVAAKNRWEEQGFYLDDNQVNYDLEPIIYERLHELSWFHLVRRVAANATIINSILGLPNDEPNLYAMVDALECWSKPKDQS